MAFQGHQISQYNTPVNGSALDATEVKNNFNNTRTYHNSHDADPTIHVQSSALASRASAGTSGRLWVSTESIGTVSPVTVATTAFDNGSTWLSETTFATTNGQPGIYSAGTITGTTATINWNNGPIQRVTLSNSSTCTFSFDNAIAGSTYTLILVQDGTGGRAIVLSGWDFGDNPPSYNTAASRKNVVSGLFDGTEYLSAFSVKGA